MNIIVDSIQWFLTAPFILLGWIIVGILAGEFARRIMGARDQGCLSDWLLGIIGALVGGFLAGAVGFSQPSGGFSLVVVNLLLSTVGAAILIAIRRAITR